MAKQIEFDEETGPQTFEEALAFAIKALAEPAAAPIPKDWLEALDRERESSSQ